MTWQRRRGSCGAIGFNSLLILYHHTHLANLPGILADGIRAGPLGWPDLADRAGCWLTTDDRSMAGRDVRIRLAIGCHERRLIHVPKILKLSPRDAANMDAIAVQAGQVNWRTFWIYECDVALNRFSKVEIATRAAA